MAQNNDSPGKRLKREEAKNTLYVSNPNDPRLQRYQDSLAIFNNNTELVNQLKKLGYSPDPVQKSNKFIAKKYLEQLEKDYKNPKVKKYLDERGYKHNKISKTLEEISDLVPGNINHQLKLQLASKEIQPAGTQAWTKWGIFNDDWIPTFDARTAFDYSNVEPKRIVEYRPKPPEKESVVTKKISPVQKPQPTQPVIERKATEIVEPLQPRQAPSPIFSREEIIAPVPRPMDVPPAPPMREPEMEEEVVTERPVARKPPKAVMPRRAGGWSNQPLLMQLFPKLYER